MENLEATEKSYWKTIQSPEYNDFVIKVLEKYYGPECILNINGHKFGVVCFLGKDFYSVTSLKDYDALCDTEHSNICDFDIEEHQSYVNNEWYAEYNTLLEGKVHHVDRPGYMLDEISTDDEGRFDKLRVRIGTYAENVFSSHVLDYELYQAYLHYAKEDIDAPDKWEQIKGSLILRNQIHEKIGLPKDKGLKSLLNGAGRDSLLSVQMLVIVKSERTKQYELIIAQRSNTVALKPGVYQFIPAGGFDILNDSDDGVYDNLELSENYSPGCAIFREYLEELYNEPEFEGKGEGSIEQRLLKDPRIKKIERMLVNKTADLHFLGSLIDLTTLRHELSFVFVLHEDIFSETQLIPNDECNRRRVYGYPVRDFDDMDTKIYRSIWDKIHIPSAAMWHMFRKTKLYESLINIPDPQPENDGNHKAPRIFISYKRVDKIKVFSIKNIIESKTGLKCWIDLDDIQSDAQFINVIAEAINNAEIVLFMYSKTHNAISDYETDWTWREINFAEHKKKRIVFVNIDQSPLSDAFSLLFGSKQQVDALSDDAMNRLFADLKQWLPEN